MSDQGQPPTPPAPPEPPRDPRASTHDATNYQGGGNSHKQRQQQSAQRPEKHIEKVVTNEVIVKKQGTGQKMRRWVSLLDFGSVARWFYKELLIPEAKRVAYRAVSEGGERIIFRNDTINHRNLGPGPVVRSQHTIYNTPVSRPGNPYPPDPRSRAIEARSRVGGVTRNNYFTRTRQEADDVIRTMYSNLEAYEQVTVADLLQMLGLPIEYTDNKWGWYDIGQPQVRQTPEGYLILLPPPEHL